MRRWVFGAAVGCGSWKLLGPLGSVVCLLERSGHSYLLLRHVVTCWSASDCTQRMKANPTPWTQPLLFSSLATQTTVLLAMLAKWVKKAENQVLSSSNSCNNLRVAKPSAVQEPNPPAPLFDKYSFPKCCSTVHKRAPPSNLAIRNCVYMEKVAVCNRMCTAVTTCPVGVMHLD